MHISVNRDIKEDDFELTPCTLNSFYLQEPLKGYYQVLLPLKTEQENLNAQIIELIL